MSAASTVSVILVNYNTKDMTSECVQSIFDKIKYKYLEVILVDNASHDGSVAALREKFPNLKVIASDENLGFGAANNLAAKNSKGDYVLLLNTDMVILDDVVEHLMEFVERHPDAGVWGGRTVFADGALNPASCWGRMTLWSVFCAVSGLRSMFPKSMLFNPEGYGGWQRDTVREVDIVTGCLLLMRRDIWERLGGFDPIFFMYGEDADLCLRAKAIGCRPMVTPDAAVVHYGGASEPMLVRKETRLLAAKVTLIKRHWRQPEQVLGLVLLRLLPYSRAIAFSALAALGNLKLSKSAELWKTIIARKQDWIFGFSS